MCRSGEDVDEKNATSGDNDPLDICVISERPIARAEVIVQARVVGGLPMLDRGEADDKIIAVLMDDAIWADAADIDDLPAPIVTVGPAYSRAHALKVIEAAVADYQQQFGNN